MGLGSRQALLTAVRDTIRAELGHKPAVCDLTWDGQPDPRCGDLFIAVCRGPRSNDSRTYLDYVHSFSVTITRRVTIPIDRLGKNNLVATGDLIDAIADPIIELLHGDPTGKLNENFAKSFGAEPPEYLAESPMYLNDDGGKIVGANWFFADPGGASDIVGVAMRINFGKAVHTRRIGA